MKFLTFCTLLLIGPLTTHAQKDDTLIKAKVDSLIRLSRFYTERKDFEQAIQANTQALNLVTNVFGKESYPYANAAFNAGRILFYKQQLNEAQSWYIVSLDTYARTIGKLNVDYVKNASNLADTYRELGKSEKAEPLYLEADSIATLLMGEINPLRVVILGNLGVSYRYRGYLERALKTCQTLSGIIEKLYGRESTEFYQNLNRIGTVYNALGDEASAEKCYLQALEFDKKQIKDHYIDYTGGLINLAQLYHSWGLLDKSRNMLLEARQILEDSTHETRHAYYRNCLYHLSMVYRESGEWDQALALLKQFLSSEEEIFGREQTNFIFSLGDLARLYQLRGDLQKADSLFNYSIATYERLAGKRPGGMLMGLGNIRWIQKNYPEALLLFQEAKQLLSVKELISGTTYFSNLIRLSEALEMQDQYLESEERFSEVFKLLRERFRQYATFLSAKQMEAYRAKFSYAYQSLNSVILNRVHSGKELGSLTEISYDQSLFDKGFLLNAATRLQALASGTPESYYLFEQLKACRRQLADAYTKQDFEKNQVAELEDKAEDLEKQLGQLVSSFGTSLQQYSWKDIQKKLEPGEIACEFISFPVVIPENTTVRQYAVLLVRHGMEKPLFVPLCSEVVLDSLLQTGGARKADYVNKLYALPDRGAALTSVPQTSLYEAIWKPLEKNLDGIQTIYCSADGLLHRINLDAIPVNDLETLGDKYNLVHLGSTRQLVRTDSQATLNQEAFLIGGIRFDSDTGYVLEGQDLALRSNMHKADSNDALKKVQDDWTFLPGTEREVTMIRRLLEERGVKAELKMGYEATEEKFNELGVTTPSPRILHIATHGYFFQDVKENGNSGLTTSGREESVFKTSDHPMLRSGLILSGGNAGWKGQKNFEGREDGVLTSYEISQMNLSNTELVVLSACETGLGDIQGNEGVYGLQRAFKIAGVKYIIMSLWQVPDKQTSMLMTTFYKKWLEAEGPAKGGNKMSIPDAFHAAQKEMREMGFDPYQWAGFVLIE